jgi:hypothetical protein
MASELAFCPRRQAGLTLDFLGEDSGTEPVHPNCSETRLLYIVEADSEPDQTLKSPGRNCVAELSLDDEKHLSANPWSFAHGDHRHEGRITAAEPALSPDSDVLGKLSPLFYGQVHSDAGIRLSFASCGGREPDTVPGLRIAQDFLVVSTRREDISSRFTTMAFNRNVRWCSSHNGCGNSSFAHLIHSQSRHAMIWGAAPMPLSLAGRALLLATVPLGMSGIPRDALRLRLFPRLRVCENSTPPVGPRVDACQTY